MPLIDAPFVRLLSLLALAGPAACTTGGQDRSTEALASGILAGELGSGLSEQAKRRAVAAEVKALSTGLSGSATRWTARGDVSGSVTPSQPYEVGAITCRRYTHQIQSPAGRQSAVGTACRKEGEPWRALE